MQLNFSSPIAHSSPTEYHWSAPVKESPNFINGEVIHGVEIIKNAEVDNILQSLPREGKLIKGLNNSYILEVSEDYQNKLYAYLEKEYGSGLKKGSVPGLCSHVSVIRPSIGDRIIDQVEMREELNQTFSFEPLYFGSVIPDHDNHWERIWLVVVSAKELEKIRTDHGMGPKIAINNKEHEFHISIANKPRQ